MGRHRRFALKSRLPLLVATTLASLYGVALVYSAVRTAGAGGFVTQAVMVPLGVAVALGLSYVPLKALVKTAWLPAALTLLLMGLTFTPLGYTVPGTDDRNWLYLSLAGRQVLFQPSELLKIVFILTFSAHLAAVKGRLHRPPVFLGVCAHGLFPALLVFLQGDDGNAVVLLLIAAALLFAAGLPRRFVVAGGVLCAAAVPLLWHGMSQEKRERFLCLIHVEQYADTTGWQQQLGIMALGAGGWCGVGYGQGGEHRLYARHNDFIFTVAGEELGFFGAVAVLLLLFLIVWLLYRAACRAANPAGRLFCLGMMTLIASQSIINIGMTLRLVPVLGITLPFFSAGGSSLFTVFAGMGVALNVAAVPTTQPLHRSP